MENVCFNGTYRHSIKAKITTKYDIWVTFSEKNYAGYKINCKIALLNNFERSNFQITRYRRCSANASTFDVKQITTTPAPNIDTQILIIKQYTVKYCFVKFVTSAGCLADIQTQYGHVVCLLCRYVDVYYVLLMRTYIFV